MSGRPTLDELRRRLLDECLDRRWRSTSDFRWRLGLHGDDWYRLCTALERLVVDGLAEIERPGSRKRRFRRPT